MSHVVTMDHMTTPHSLRVPDKDQTKELQRLMSYVEEYVEENFAEELAKVGETVALHFDYTGRLARICNEWFHAGNVAGFSVEDLEEIAKVYARSRDIVIKQLLLRELAYYTIGLDGIDAITSTHQPTDRLLGQSISG